MKSNHLTFSTKVWAFSALVTPTVAGFFIGIFGPFSLEPPFAGLFFVAPAGLILSIPNYYILILCAWQINISKLSLFEKKIILNLISIILTYSLFEMLFYYIGESSNHEMLWLTVGYSITLTIAIWYYPLTLVPENPSEAPKQRVPILEDIIDDEIY